MIGKPEVERYLPDQLREMYTEGMEDQKPFQEQMPEQVEHVAYVESYVVDIELLPDGYEETTTYPVEYIVEEPESPTHIVPFVEPPPPEPIFCYSVRGVQFTPLDFNDDDFFM